MEEKKPIAPPEPKLELTKNNIPDNVKFALDPLSGKLEGISATLYSTVKEFFSKKENTLEYGILVVKVMETVDTFKKLKGKEKEILATRCIVELLMDSEHIPEDTKKDLMITIPGSIKAVIQLSKGTPLNINTKGIDIVEISYITQRAVDRIIEYMKEKKFNLMGVLENIFMILTQIMYVIGCYPSLTGKQKKEIAISVINTIITKYSEHDNKIPEQFINITMESVPSIIDVFVSVSEGHFDINTIKKCCFTCIPLCFSRNNI